MESTPNKLTDSEIVHLFEYLTIISVSVQKAFEFSSEWSSELIPCFTDMVCELSLTLSLEADVGEIPHLDKLKTVLLDLTAKAQHVPVLGIYSYQLLRLSKTILQAIKQINELVVLI